MSHTSPARQFMLRRFRRSGLGPLLGLLVAMQAIACSSDDNGRHVNNLGSPGDLRQAGRAIRVFVGEPGSWKRVDFGPAGRRKGNRAKTTSSSSALKPTSLRTQDHVIPENSSIDGFSLVWGAAVQCGMIHADANVPAGIHPSIAAMQAIEPAFGGTGFYVFNRKPANCDEHLAFSETILCIADRLEEVSSSPNVIVWDRLETASVTPPFTGVAPGKWRIMPQAPEDRFVARDLAIDALSQLVMLDTVAPEPEDNRVCADILSQAAREAGWATQRSYVFGVTGAGAPAYFEPQLAVDPGAQEMARARLAFHSHTLRAGARLLKSLIADSVASDMAAAETRRSRATDPLRGARAAWGFEEDGDGGFNSLAHAVRAVAGRWDMAGLRGGDVYVDPVLMVRDGFQAAVEARIEDVTPRTPGQIEASAMISSSGLVLPESAFSEGLTDVRAVLTDQLARARAADRGVTTGSDEFVAEMLAIEDSVKRVADEDLRFALRRQLVHYAQLTSQEPDSAIIDASAYGLRPAAQQADGLAVLEGIVVEGAVPVCDLPSDVIGLAAGALINSQVVEDALGEEGLLHADRRMRWPGQDSFALAQSFQSRLTVLREVSDWEGAANPGEAADVAGRAVAEVRAWAGPGRVGVIPSGTDAPTALTLYLTGFEPEDLPEQSLLSEVRLVYGEPWVAECAAGLRSTCPTGFADNYVVAPTTETSLASGTSWRRTYGTDGILTKLAFTALTGASQFQPAYNDSTSGKRLYVVLRHDRASANGQGKVLAALSLQGAGKGTSAAVSRTQRRALEDAIGVRKEWCSRKDKPGEPPTSVSPKYCLEGVDRNFTVPLENELTSDGDQYENSWRHYLNLARQYAAKADELGEKMIQLGVQQDERREQSNDRLAQICGDYSAMDKVKVGFGNVAAPADDKTLSTCLSEERYHVTGMQ